MEGDITEKPIGEQYKPICAKWNVVRDMAKNGVIDQLTIRHLYELQIQQEEMQKQKMQEKLRGDHE